MKTHIAFKISNGEVYFLQDNGDPPTKEITLYSVMNWTTLTRLIGNSMEWQPLHLQEFALARKQELNEFLLTGK